MRFVEEAAAALERAQRNQDCAPLNRLITRTIPRFATISPNHEGGADTAVQIFIRNAAVLINAGSRPFP